MEKREILETDSQVSYVIVCNHLGACFSTRESVQEGIQKLSEITGFPKHSFDFLALYPN